jgi:ribosomal-protein-alanine N-acetyltransferase
MVSVTLRPISVKDAERCFRWVSDPEVSEYLGLLQPARTLEQERAWIASVLADRQHQRTFVVKDEAGQPIGTCGLRAIDAEQKTALFGIMIGERRLWGRGYGTAATEAVLSFGFGKLGLREIRLSCHRENRRALRCYEKAGFRLSSYRSRQHQFGREEVGMAIRREDWLARRSGEGEEDAVGAVDGGDTGEPGGQGES